MNPPNADLAQALAALLKKTHECPTRSLKHAVIPWLVLAACSLCSSANAQTASWTNLAGGDWNTAVNWDVGVVPGVGTNVLITNRAPAYSVSYSAPMSAASISSVFLTNGTAPATVTLNINAAGFNVTANITNRFGSSTVVGAGGVVNCAGWQVVSNASVVIAAGGIVTNSGTMGVGSPLGNGVVTNNGGILVNTTTTIGGTADGGPMVILGGTNFLGTFSIARAVTLDATNGAPNGPLIVLTSTNVTLPLSNWTPIATNAFDANGVLSGLSIPVDPTVDEQYFTLLVH